MTLAAVLDQAGLDALSDAIKGEYIENPDKKGSFIPDIKPQDGYEFANTTNLKNALGQERHAKSESEKLLKAFDGLEATSVREALAKLELLKDANPDAKAKEQFESMKGDLIKAHMSEKDAMQATVDNALGQLKGTLVDAEVVKAIVAANGSVDLLTPIISGNVTMRQDGDKFFAEVVDSKGVVRVGGGDGSAMTISQLVEEYKSNEKYGAAFAGTGNSGSGAGSGDSSDKGSGGSGDKKIATPGSVDRKDQAAINNSLESIASGDTKVE